LDSTVLFLCNALYAQILIKHIPVLQRNVRQNDFVFNMTIKENILLDDEFTEEEFFDAVRKAKVNKFVYLLENGYDT